MEQSRFRAWLIAIALLLSLRPLHAADVDVAKFADMDAFESIKLSPTGEYYALTIPIEDQTVLALRRRSDNQLVGSFGMGKRTHVHDFWWVNPTRVVFNVAEKMGALDEPRLTGELYAMNADGSNAEILVGQRVGGTPLGTRLGTKKEERVAALMIDDLPNDDRNVLIDVFRFVDDPESRVERMDVYTGKRSRVVQGPIQNVSFVTDNAGNVRFAQGGGVDLRSRLYYRGTGEDEDWKQLNDESTSGHGESVLGFAEDDRAAYLLVEQPQGPDAIVALDVATGNRRDVLRDDDVDPSRIVYRPGTSIPVGVGYMDGIPHTKFFDPTSADARFQHSLEAAFKGQAVHVISATVDGSLALVETSSDRNPGDVYVFDTARKDAAYLVGRRAAIDPKSMSAMRPIELKSRDGRVLHGYLTLPDGAGEESLPMVVLPHGGPFGIFDVWGFDPEVQMLAAAGYAVLQVNYRGSGNYGRAFRQAGARQWGMAMQDDITDATRWAIEQGYADAGRVCIYGASYGAYAALMGAAREPELYRCAAGYVGVYDLPQMFEKGDIQGKHSGQAYLRQWLGEPGALASVSPTRLASRIKAPVFLAAGDEDDRAPVSHTREMERALKAADVPVESLYYPKEGHGFYNKANRREYYTRLLAFLKRNIGTAEEGARN